ncbi:MAG TPA: transglutaminase-like domain-containing protein, partial [Thermoanaerobaculia bacterium]|nr:transglutaminase-like domain-containing protein [Thermoanaerobaculia bacterium]
GETYRLTYRPRRILEYDVGLAHEVPEEPDAAPPGPGSPALDTTGVTPRMRQLAVRVMGTGSREARSHRLERYLMSNYQYSSSFTGQGGAMAVDEFLFDTKSGHCEYFASAMVLLLRSQGIPARLVTGFLGAEYNPLEGTYVVRELNAHAWVEAWIDGRGWMEFDPTPAAGRPPAATPGFALFMSQAWDYLQFRWDRYVLTYGFADQFDMFRRLRHLWFGFWHRFSSSPKTATPSATAVSATSRGETNAADVGRAHTVAGWYLAAGVLLALVLVALALLWRAARVDGARAFERLREALVNRGEPVPSSLPPLAVAARLAAVCPDAAAPGARLVELYLRESFGGQELGDAERDVLKRSLKDARRCLRRSG